MRVPSFQGGRLWGSLLLPSVSALLLCLSAVSAQESGVQRSLEDLPQREARPLGLTDHGQRIEAVLTAEDRDIFTRKTRLMLIGMPGDDVVSGEATAAGILAVLQWFDTSAEAAEWRTKFSLSAVPIWRKPEETKQKSESAAVGFPPTGPFYHGPDREAKFLWRSLGWLAPDGVICVQFGKEPKILFPSLSEKTPAVLNEAFQKFTQSLPKNWIAEQAAEKHSLAAQLMTQPAGNVGLIPAIQLECSPDQLLSTVQRMLDAEWIALSPARKELQRRQKRSALEVAEDLAQHYGQNLSSVVYIPTVALMGRVRLGKLTNNPQHLADVERIIEPYRSGKRPALPDKPSSSHLSGHLIFTELARQIGNPRDLELARQVAELGFEQNGQLKKSMPFHSEMSDSVFMACPILAQVGALTGEDRYFEMAWKHALFMQKLCLRKDGLYRHSPLDEAAWGRGNGFPALGLTLCLEYWPEDQKHFPAVLEAYQQHLQALKVYQDAEGCWHQVIDHPQSYREFSSTCMITYAILVGLERGWLSEEDYAPVVERAWPAILARIGPKGEVFDICTGTGKQKSLQDYLDRPAILGHDDRGGAMALWVAVKMAERERSR